MESGGLCAWGLGAARSEITSAKEQRGFRSSNPRVLKQGLTNSKLNVKPELPSDQNVDWTYGRQSSNVTIEVSRVAGGGCVPHPHILIPLPLLPPCPGSVAVHRAWIAASRLCAVASLVRTRASRTLRLLL